MQTNLESAAIRSQTMVLPFQRLTDRASATRARFGWHDRGMAAPGVQLGFAISDRREDLVWVCLGLCSFGAVALALFA